MNLDFPFIAGSGRSGTTWVLDALARANGLTTIFEPLHPAVSQAGTRFAYSALGPDAIEPDLEALFYDVTRTRSLGLWTRHRGRSDLLFPKVTDLFDANGLRALWGHWHFFVKGHRTIPPGRYREQPIVKCIRANLMLAWIRNNVTSRIAFIIRHPAEVIHSQLSGSPDLWDPFPILNRYSGDEQFEQITGGRYRHLLRRQLSRPEAHAAAWVIENQIPIEQAKNGTIGVFRHDELVANPADSWPKLCKALGLIQIPSFTHLNAPSQQGRGRTRKWAFSQPDAHAIQEIFDSVGFDFFNMRNSGDSRQYINASVERCES